MEIFKEELAISHLIESDTSIAFDCKPISAEGDDVIRIKESLAEIATADINDDDLYYHKSILVTTNWNANDDVFIPSESWAARKSPVHKPTNLNHSSSKIVGHITGNWAIDSEGNLISDNIKAEDLPSKFHILTGAVIYKKYHDDPEYQNIVARLIEEIKDGKQFVSMECKFKGFGYAIMNENGDIQILDRNNETAFLTKHLRAYGGSGRYENHKIGRVLKDISFIGKAYTPRPANKESIIFTQSDMFDFANANKNSVLDISKVDLNGENPMSDVLQDQIRDLTSKNEALSSELDQVKTKLAEADVQKYVSEIDSLRSENSALTEAMTDEKKKMEEKEKSMVDYKSKAETLQTELDAAKAELDKIRLEQVYAARVTMLVDGKLDRASAENKVKLFDNLSDDQFKVLADELISSATKSAETTVQTEVETAKTADLDSSKADEKVTTAEETVVAEDPVDFIVTLAQKIKKELNKGDK